MLAGWARRFDLRPAAAQTAAGGSAVQMDFKKLFGLDDSGSTAATGGALAGGAAAGGAAAGAQMGGGDGGGADGGGGVSCLSAVLFGYAAGCFLLEVAPPGPSRAALLFLVPSTVSALVANLAVRGELQAAFAFGGAPRKPEPDAEPGTTTDGE